MNILELAILKKMVGGGGGSGTDNYNDLSNLPQINGETLAGDKSSSSLGLQSEIKEGSELASDLVDDTNQDNKFVTSAEKLEWSGKQNLIDSSHKLSSDLVDDADKTNKFVTASEKETWNGKQNLIDNSHKLSSDLVDDTNKTNKFVTSTEKNTWNAKQNAIDSDHKLSSSLVSFSEAEAAALASGINSTKVGQISTNQSNILYTLNRTGKNCTDIQNPYVSKTNTGTQTVTYGQNGEVTISINNATWASYHFLGYVKPNTAYTLVTYVTDFTSITNVFIKENLTDDTNLISFAIEGNGTIVKTLTTGASEKIRLCYSLNNSGTAKTSSITLRVMLVETTTYNMDSTYVPPALPNYDLTRLEAEDRASLAEVVDSGAKNKLQYDLTSLKAANTDGTWNSNVYTVLGISFTVNSDLTISVSGTRTSTTGNAILNLSSYTANSNEVLSQGVTYSSCYLYARGGSTTCSSASSTAILPNDIGVSRTYSIAVPSVVTGAVNVKISPMICTKAAFGVSSKFVPYRPNWDAIQAAITPSTFAITGQTGITISDLDTRKCNGVAWFSMIMKSNRDIAVDTNTSIATIEAATKKKSGALVVFNAVVSNRPEISARVWISGTTNLQTIQLRTDVLIPANTLVYITGSYLY